MDNAMKLRVVDDERDVEMLFRQKFRKELRQDLLELVSVFSGQEALDILKSNDPPEIMYIFSDINMSGLVLLKTVKSEFPEIKVSMISAYGDQENYDRAMESGAKEFFTKPIDFNSLKDEILKKI